MVEAKDKGSSHWWWFESHKNGNSNRSPWLQSTLADLDEKTKTMLKLIEEDADSFAQRAEMYYRKRPELINMVEDFYRTHRSLIERYDQMKTECGARFQTPWSSSPLSFTKYQLEKSFSSSDKAYDSYSDACGPYSDSDESEIDDPEEEEPMLDLIESRKVEISSRSCNEELMRLREEVERLKQENKVQKEEIMQKDEEKREVIRQLSLAIDMLREENNKMRKHVVKSISKNESGLDFNKLKENFFGKLFSGFHKPQENLVAF